MADAERREMFMPLPNRQVLGDTRRKQAHHRVWQRDELHNNETGGNSRNEQQAARCNSLSTEPNIRQPCYEGGHRNCSVQSAGTIASTAPGKRGEHYQGP